MRVLGLAAACMLSMCMAMPELGPEELGSEEQSLIAISETLNTGSALADEPVEEEGTNVAQCWRLRSLVRANGPRQGFEWSISNLAFFSTSDGSGDALSGDVSASSVKEDTENVAENAFDGNSANRWQANGMDSGEYIILKLPEAKEVRSIRIQQLDEQSSVNQAVLEKSINCKGWARVAEFPQMSGSFGKGELLTFSSVDTIPSGVFQIRSRSNIDKCVGVAPDDDEVESISEGIPQKTASFGSNIVIQQCSVAVLPQFWSFTDAGLLMNAKNGVLQLELDGSNQVLLSGKATLGDCTGAACNDLKSGLRYNEGAGDGLFLHRGKTNLILAPREGSLDEGTVIEVTTCSDEGEDATIEACADKPFGQFDVPPMFTIESRKMAENCAPYSHNGGAAPLESATRLSAQKACAADNKCTVYMWADQSTGNDANKAWLCESLGNVYPGKQGYELGFRVRG
eukprot:TRINITY_DN338_c0_g1_i2.p1 TRINITY_DN338_c0_g1~~TRINITY_DN338_c0_g1_i2.p1  ORF type:complete len:457 (-),score=100.95 TRINITY_DN338_c0_g1_i2:311-1681(-)